MGKKHEEQDDVDRDCEEVDKLRAVAKQETRMVTVVISITMSWHFSLQAEEVILSLGSSLQGEALTVCACAK